MENAYAKTIHIRMAYHVILGIIIMNYSNTYKFNFFYLQVSDSGGSAISNEKFDSIVLDDQITISKILLHYVGQINRCLKKFHSIILDDQITVSKNYIPSY